MPWPLSVPVLLLLAWGMAGLLWWDGRRRIIPRSQVPWTITAMLLVAIAMVLALVTVPAPTVQQLLRLFVMAEAVYGSTTLVRRYRQNGR